jgi:hypothetical protein
MLEICKEVIQQMTRKTAIILGGSVSDFLAHQLLWVLI